MKIKNKKNNLKRTIILDNGTKITGGKKILKKISLGQYT